MTLILQDVLKRWARAMRAKIRAEPDLRPVRNLGHVCLIMDDLKIYQDCYESKFGQTEESNPDRLGEINGSAVYGIKEDPIDLTICCSQAIGC